MSQEFIVREAKARLSELLDLAAAGIPVEITRQRPDLAPVSPDTQAVRFEPR